MKLYIIRHGQTEWNKLQIIQGSSDIPLNEIGKKQVLKTSEQFNDKSFDLIISSPLLRAKETSEILNRNYNKEIIFDNRLAERNFGKFEGLKKVDIPYDDFWNFNLNKKYEKAENIKEFYNRVIEFIEYIKIKYKNKTILLSTHAGVCKVIEYYINPTSEKSNNGNLGLYSPDNLEIIEYEL